MPMIKHALYSLTHCVRSGMESYLFVFKYQNDESIPNCNELVVKALGLPYSDDDSAYWSEVSYLCPPGHPGAAGGAYDPHDFILADVPVLTLQDFEKHLSPDTFFDTDRIPTFMKRYLESLVALDGGSELTLDDIDLTPLDALEFHRTFGGELVDGETMLDLLIERHGESQNIKELLHPIPAPVADGETS